jgi:hypothetical protein
MVNLNSICANYEILLIMHYNGTSDKMKNINNGTSDKMKNINLLDNPIRTLELTILINVHNNTNLVIAIYVLS